MMQLFRRKKKQTEKEQLADIEEVVDQLAYKYSIPQTIIRRIIMRWMDFERKRWGLDD